MTLFVSSSIHPGGIRPKAQSLKLDVGVQYRQAEGKLDRPTDGRRRTKVGERIAIEQHVTVRRDSMKDDVKGNEHRLTLDVGVDVKAASRTSC